MAASKSASTSTVTGEDIMQNNKTIWSGRIIERPRHPVPWPLTAPLKLCAIPIVPETMGNPGYPPSVELARGLGIVTLLCTALYAFRARGARGDSAHGYMGGAMATHLRVGSPLFSHMLFGFYLGLMIWGGLYLRDERLRVLIRCDARGGSFMTIDVHYRLSLRINRRNGNGASSRASIA